MVDEKAERKDVAPEPTLSVCEKLLEAARDMLREAWENPQALGESSAICSKAVRLSDTIRAHRTPQAANVDARQVFLDAMRLSWLAIWRARDYSIPGMRRRLKERSWPNDYVFQDRLANNVGQDYGGVRWLNTHYPAFGMDGESLPPISRKPLSSIVSTAWADITEGATLVDPATLENKRTSLDWACVVGSLPDVEGGFSLENAFVASAANLRSIRAQSGPPCRNAIFRRPVVIHELRAASLDATSGARFEEGVTFSGSQFSADVAIPDDVEFGPTLKFHGCIFKGGLLISNPKGLRKVQFPGTEMVGILAIKDTPDGLALQLPPKVGGLSAPGVTFFELDAVGAEVLGNLDLTRCTFTGRVDATSARIRGHAQVVRARFDGIGAPSFASFHRTVFEGGADFSFADFGQAAESQVAVGARAVYFSSAAFGGPATFRAAQFRCDAFFDNADFRDLNCDNVGDSKTQFYGIASFRGGAESEPGERREVIHSAKFDEVVFHGASNFRNRRFEDDTSFDGATFARAPSFHGSEFHQKTSFVGARFQWRSGLQLSGWRRFAASRLPIFHKRALALLKMDNRYLADVSDSFRVLTTLAKNIESSELAFAFHREEQRAKHYTSAGSDVPRSEAFFGAAYGLFSDYGGSLSRPLIGLLTTFVAFSWLYSILLGDGPSNCMLWEQGCQISSAVAIAAERTLLPIASSSGPLADDWNEAVLASPFWASVASLVHRLVGAVLLFLLALALKRRFQLS